jgi:hypothetical protein
MNLFSFPACLCSAWSSSWTDFEGAMVLNM